MVHTGPNAFSVEDEGEEGYVNYVQEAQTQLDNVRAPPKFVGDPGGGGFT